MNGLAIKVSGLTKDFEVYPRPIDLALELLTRKSRHTVFRALDDVSFDVNRGEVLGIIGENGAGKSTLLKIITGVLDQTSGVVDVYGKVTAILELGLGFNPEYSGRENIYLSGLLYGMGRAEIDSKIDSIIGFSGLDEFIERPVKIYSSGMHARLAFSIATAVDPDILIIDEALAAGDAAFVQKCLRRIRSLCSGGRTVLVVSHGTGLLAQLCHRVMWIDRGKVRMIGPALKIVQAYDLEAHKKSDSSSWLEAVDDNFGPAASLESSEQSASLNSGPPEDSSGSIQDTSQSLEHTFGSGEIGRQVFRRGPVEIEKVELLDHRNEPTSHLVSLYPFSIRVRYFVKDGEVPDVSIGIALAVNNKLDLSPVGQFTTQHIRPYEDRDTYSAAKFRPRLAEKGEITLSFPEVPFRKGEYLLSLGILPNDPASWHFYEYRHLYYYFKVDDGGLDLGAPIWLSPNIRHAVLEQGLSVAVPPPEKENDFCTDTTAIATLRDEINEVCFAKGGYPDQWPVHAACPACDGNVFKPIFDKYGISHSQCFNCGLVFVNPYPPAEILRSLYAGKYYSAVRELFEVPLMAHNEATPFSAPEDTLTEIVARATEGRATGDWLDVGGGVGAFASLIERQRPGWRVVLNELNPVSVVAARASGLTVVSDDPTNLAAAGVSFDVVSSIAVLEHVPHPLQFLQDSIALVQPGGWFVHVVPHFTHLNASVSRASSPNVVPPYHVSLFNEQSIRLLFERIEDVAELEITQCGAAAFELIQHVDFGDQWDISIPTEQEPTPQSIQIGKYTNGQGIALASLSGASKETSAYFEENDGRSLLVIMGRKRGNPDGQAAP